MHGPQILEYTRRSQLKRIAKAPTRRHHGYPIVDVAEPALAVTRITVLGLTRSPAAEAGAGAGSAAGRFEVKDVVYEFSRPSAHRPLGA